MSYFKDQEFQEHLLAFLCRDRNFLKKLGGLLTPNDFKPRKDETPERQILASLALGFWKNYREPIGGLLKSEILDYCRDPRNKVGRKLKDKLLDLVTDIKRNHSLVAVEAITQKVIAYKNRRAKYDAIKELIGLQEAGNLTDSAFLKVMRKASKSFEAQYTVVDFFETKELEKRQRRRAMSGQQKWPMLMIDPIDMHVRAITRGGLGMVLAPLKVGKSQFMIWLAQAYAVQGFNVMLFTLEDSKELVEDRLDAIFTGLTMAQLEKYPRRLRNRFRRAQERVQGKIRIIDATDGNWTVSRIEQVWDQERNMGFTADCVLIDYDEYIKSVNKYSGDSAMRQKYDEIWMDLKHFAARADIFLWCAAQARRPKPGQKLVTVSDTAEDIGKARKATFCIGIGNYPDWGEDARFLNIAAHRYDKQHIGWPILSDFDRSLIYDREATMLKMVEKAKKKKVEEE